MGDINLGKKILRYRNAKGLSIRNFAKLTDLSPSLLSQIERGIANPSLNALKSIANALEVPLFSLFIGEIETESLILRKEDRKKIYKSNKQHILYDMLTPSPLKSNVELLLMNLNPNSETGKEFTEHEGEEIGFVIEGEVYLVFEEEEFLLKEGDTVRILPHRKHKFRNETEKNVRVLFIKSKIVL